jgi:ABC-type lipoprotein release transport system permease subunit
LSVTDLDALANSIRTSIDPQAVGWWILTGLAALVGLVVLAQALARQSALDAEDYPSVAALGATRRQLFTVTMVRNFVLAVLGAIGGVVLAAALSVFLPVGEARLADPNPGFDFDALLLIGGALAAVGVLLLLSVWPASRASTVRSSQDQGRMTRPSSAVRWLSASGAPPTALIGVRNALERGRGRNAVPLGSALVGAVLAVTVLCGTAVFGASLTYLTGTPSQYGQGFDAWFSLNATGQTSQSAHLLTSLERPGVTAITAGVSDVVRINGKVVDALAGQSVRGPFGIPTTSGHPLVSDDEVILGAKTMREVGARLGGSVDVVLQTTGGSIERAKPFRVVGTAAFPPDFDNQGLGTGAIFTLQALTGSDCRGGSEQQCLASAVQDSGGSFLVTVAQNAQGRSALSSLSNSYSGQANLPYPPTNLVNFGRAINFPLIFGIIVVAFGIATLLHLLLTSLTRRRREMGLLKSLGFVRRQIALAVSWQTTTVALVGLVIGIPLGIAAGRATWEAFADNLGVGTQPVVTASEIALLSLGVLVVANLLAVVPAFVAARVAPASLLRTE